MVKGLSLDPKMKDGEIYHFTCAEKAPLNFMNASVLFRANLPILTHGRTRISRPALLERTSGEPASLSNSCRDPTCIYVQPMGSQT